MGTNSAGQAASIGAFRDVDPAQLRKLVSPKIWDLLFPEVRKGEERTSESNVQSVVLCHNGEAEEKWLSVADM